MRKMTYAVAGVGILLAAVVAPATAAGNPSPSTTRYEVTLVGNVETSTAVGATTMYIHVTNSAAIKREGATKFSYQFKGVIVPVALDTKTVVRRLSTDDHVSLTATGLTALNTVPLLAGDQVTAKVRCSAVNPPQCIAAIISAFTPEPKHYDVQFVGRVTGYTDTRTVTVRPSILLEENDSKNSVTAMVGTDVKVLGTAKTVLTLNGTRTTGSFAGMAAGQLAVVEGKCYAPVAPATQWTCTASKVTAATLA